MIATRGLVTHFLQDLRKGSGVEFDELLVAVS